MVIGNKALGEIEPLMGFHSYVWMDFENGKAKVIYPNEQKKKYALMKELLVQVKLIFFLIGIYSIPFAIYLGFQSRGRALLNTRGMFHP